MRASAVGQPAMNRPDDDYVPGTVIQGRAGDVMVLFRDGTWHLCRVTGWHKTEGRWLVRFRWGVAGERYEAWYFHDPVKTWQLTRPGRAAGPPPRT